MIKSDLARARQITSPQAWGHEMRDSGEAPSQNRRLSFQIAESKKDSTEANPPGFQRRNKLWLCKTLDLAVLCLPTCFISHRIKTTPALSPPRRSVFVGRDRRSWAAIPGKCNFTAKKHGNKAGYKFYIWFPRRPLVEHILELVT